MRRLTLVLCVTCAPFLLSPACAEDDDGDLDDVGRACGVPDDCFPETEDPSQIPGEILCLDRVPSGYCTHTCTSDADCCSVEGECDDQIPQVCAPFESTGMMMCFISCEGDVLGDRDEGEYCQNEAHSAFGCRSTGGGSANRKVCVP